MFVLVTVFSFYHNHIPSKQVGVFLRGMRPFEKDCEGESILGDYGISIRHFHSVPPVQSFILAQSTCITKHYQLHSMHEINN